jgi:hypothetical protein
MTPRPIECSNAPCAAPGIYKRRKRLLERPSRRFRNKITRQAGACLAQMRGGSLRIIGVLERAGYPGDVSVPVSRRPNPDVSPPSGMASYPDGASTRRPFPVAVDPDPHSRAYGVVSLDPDMKPARTGRTRDDDRRRGWRRAADLNFFDDNRTGDRPVGNDNAAGQKNNRNKTRPAQEILYTLHNLLLPSTHKPIPSSPAPSVMDFKMLRFLAGGSYCALIYLRQEETRE